MQSPFTEITEQNLFLPYNPFERHTAYVLRDWEGTPMRRFVRLWHSYTPFRIVCTGYTNSFFIYFVECRVRSSGDIGKKSYHDSIAIYTERPPTGIKTITIP